MTRALILGIGGQDGAYLTRLLRAQGHAVTGIARHLGTARARLTALGVGDEVVVTDEGGFPALLASFAPDEVYDLRAARTAPSLAALIEAARQLPRVSRLLVAASGAMFGDTGGGAANEGAPRAADADYDSVVEARADGLFAVTAILFDHASRLGPVGGRAAAFVDAAWAIAQGAATEMTLTTPDAARDWGWAPEYVDAMTRLLGQAEPRDYVVATGTRLTDRDFAHHALTWFKLDPERHLHVVADAAPPSANVGDPSAIARDLGWKAYTHGRDLVATLCEGRAGA